MLETKASPVSFPRIISEVVIKATAQFFQNVCGAIPTPKPVPASDSPVGGVMGVISFVGDQGFSFAMALPEHTAVSVAQKFAGFEIPYDSPDMGDVIGELANVIAGDIVALLDNQGVKVQMSLPLVTRGHDFEVLVPPTLPTLRLNFTSPEGDFCLKLVTSKSKVFTGRASGS